MSAHELRGYELVLIDTPFQRHVVEWEKAVRALKSEDAKPALLRLQTVLEAVNASEQSIPALIAVVSTASGALRDALRILAENEAATLSSNRGVMVKAAIRSGWITSPVMCEDDVDTMPPWLVQWIAERVATLYEEVTTIPKN